MKKTIMLTVPLLVLAYYGTSQVTTAEVECVKQPGDMPTCQNAPHVNINNQSKNISPRNICGTPGQTITFNVTPNGTTASMEGKDGGWPMGSGSSWQIVVPEAEAGEYFDYNVHFEDDSCIDPRITVSK